LEIEGRRWTILGTDGYGVRGEVPSTQGVRRQIPSMGPHLLEGRFNTLKEMKAQMAEVDLTLFVSSC